MAVRAFNRILSYIQPKKSIKQEGYVKELRGQIYSQ
jgi:hypothetical protein